MTQVTICNSVITHPHPRNLEGAKVIIQIIKLWVEDFNSQPLFKSYTLKS